MSAPNFISNETSVYNKILDSYCSDISKAQAILPEIEDDNVSIVALPDEPWSRRVIGVYANLLMHGDKNNFIKEFKKQFSTNVFTPEFRH